MVLYISALGFLNIPYLSPPSGSCPPRFAPRPQPAPSLRSCPGASLGGLRSGDFAPSLFAALEISRALRALLRRGKPPATPVAPSPLNSLRAFNPSSLSGAVALIQPSSGEQRRGRCPPVGGLGSLALHRFVGSRWSLIKRESATRKARQG